MNRSHRRWKCRHGDQVAPDESLPTKSDIDTVINFFPNNTHERFFEGDSECGNWIKF